jgi:hypothetical protein
MAPDVQIKPMMPKTTKLAQFVKKHALWYNFTTVGADQQGLKHFRPLNYLLRFETQRHGGYELGKHSFFQ